MTTKQKTTTTVEVYPDGSGQWRFRVGDDVSPRGFTRKAQAVEAAEAEHPGAEVVTAA